MAGGEVVIDKKYLPYVLKRYKYWTLLLHESQRYLGRAVVWLSREGTMQRYSSLKCCELKELQAICLEYEELLNEVGWRPDHMNYAWLGNFMHLHSGHGHMHLIPRYDPYIDVPSFKGVRFNDNKWGKNYAPESPKYIPEKLVRSIASFLRKKMEGQKQ